MDPRPECLEPEDHRRDWPKMAFVCKGCKRYVCGWCEGGSDDLPNHCDKCWADTYTPLVPPEQTP